MSLPQIEKKLGQLRGHIRLMFVSFGLAKILIWASALTLWLYYTDRVLQLPSGVRIAFLIIAILTLIVVGIRSLVYPMSKTVSDEDLALLVEREYPLLNDRLISSLQMLKTQERYKDAASDQMIRHVVAETFEVAGKLKFEESVRSRHLMTMVLVSIFAMLAVFGHALLDRDNMSVWAQRVLGGGQDWPTSTQLIVYILDDEDLAQYPTTDQLAFNFRFNSEFEISELGIKGVYDVAEGSDIRFVAVPSGDVIPDEAEIEVVSYQLDPTSGKYVKIGNSTTRAMKINTSDVDSKQAYFGYNKVSMMTPLEVITVHSGDATDGPFVLRKIPAPALDSPLLFSFEYPEYLSIPSYETDQSRDIKAVQGTKVVLTFSTTKPLLLEGRKGSALIIDYAVGSSERVVINTDGVSDGSKENSYKVTISGLRKGMSQYRLQLVDRQGITSIKKVNGVIDVDEDLPPSVKIRFSGDPLLSNQQVYVVPDAVIPIELELSDDYGVGSARMFWKLNDGSAFKEYTEFSEWLKEKIPQPQRKFSGTFELDFEALLFAANMPNIRTSVEIYIQAYDLNQVKGKSEGDLTTLQGSRSPTLMTYELYTVDELRVKISSQIRQVKTTIRGMAKLLEDGGSTEKVRGLIEITRDALKQPKLLDFKSPDGKALRIELNEAYQRQNQLLRDAEVVLRRFSIFAQIYQFNRIERRDLARPQETHIQNVRLLCAIASAERELQQSINNPLMRLEEAKDQEVPALGRSVINALAKVLSRALPVSGFSHKTFGELIQDTRLHMPGCIERSRAQYEALLEVNIRPQDRREILVELEKQQVLTLLVLEKIQEQVKAWEGFDDILHGFRNLLHSTEDINKEVKKEIE